MKTLKTIALILLLSFSNLPQVVAKSDENFTISGMITSSEEQSVEFASIFLKGTPHGVWSNEKGEWIINAPAGKYTLCVSAVGYHEFEKEIEIGKNLSGEFHIELTPNIEMMEEAVITAGAISKVKLSAFNAMEIKTDALINSTKSLSEALSTLPGMKLRESGGVGSDMQIMLDGFSGKHVKIFIDGVPQEGVGAAFDINNIPVNFAEKIEVYKGVVPVHFGTDAIGGVINIVTNKNMRKWFANASYSYGSFNTHKSHINAGQTLQNGFSYELNLFQNYSDNSYFVDTWVREFEVLEDGSIYKYPINKNDIKHVRRFHDNFHNEAAIAKLGVVGKKWADRLMFGISYSQFYKEIQTGVYQDIVFGEKHRRGYYISPSIEYIDKNFIIEDLSLKANLNYNHNIVNNIDTSSRAYNWYGESYDKGSKGEQSYQNSISKNTNWNGNLNLSYSLGKAHRWTINHIFGRYDRTSRSQVGTSSVLTDFSIPKVTVKNITGFSYLFSPSKKWNATAFAKFYSQFNQGPVSQNADGVGNYIQMSNTTSAWGYGAAATYFPLKGLQLKLSYEHALRLPTTDELFGDEDMEAGKSDLKPEKSDNLNFNLNYNFTVGKHYFSTEGSFVYRDTKDYIKRGLGKHGSTQYGFYENHGHVKTIGFNVSLRYSYSKWFTIGGTFNNFNTRDYEKTWTGNSQQESMHYKVRLPNTPYLFANWDAGFFWNDLFAKGNKLTLLYDAYYQHSFPLYWENIGSADSKAYVPDQLSHNITLSYAFDHDRYTISAECRNITNAQLYDNFSLQKAGRAFYIKLRINLQGY